MPPVRTPVQLFPYGVQVKGATILQALRREPVDLEIATGHVAVDLTRSSLLRLALTGDVTIDEPTGLIEGTEFYLAITQDGTGGRDVAWDAIFDWGEAGPPAFTDDDPDTASLVHGVVVAEDKILVTSVRGEGNGDPAAGGGTFDVDTDLADAVSGAHVKAFADADLTPGVVIHFTIPIANASAATDRIVTEPFEIIDAWAQKRGAAGGAGGTWAVKKGATTIGTIDASGADKTLARIGSIDDAGGASTFAAGNTLRIQATQGAGPTDVEGLIHILAIKR